MSVDQEGPRTYAVPCPRCDGTGRDPERDPRTYDWRDCWECENNRVVYFPASDLSPIQIQELVDRRLEQGTRLAEALTDVNHQIIDLLHHMPGRRHG